MATEDLAALKQITRMGAQRKRALFFTINGSLCGFCYVLGVDSSVISVLMEGPNGILGDRPHTKERRILPKPSLKAESILIRDRLITNFITI